MSKQRRAGDRGRRGRAATPGSAAPAKVRDIFVARPFEGLRGRARLGRPAGAGAGRHRPAAAVPEALAKEYGEREVTLATVLPMAWPALTKPDGRIFLGLQRGTQSGDVSRDLALSLLLALEAEPGGPVVLPPLPGPGPRLQDVLADDGLDVTIRDGFDFWLDEESSDPEVRASLERANGVDLPDRAAGRRPGRVLVPVPGEGPCALGARRRRGRGAGRAVPAVPAPAS